MSGLSYIYIYIYIHTHTQGDQKVSVHLMITIQKVTSNVQSVPRQSPDIYWQAAMYSGIPNSNYVIMVGHWNCLKYCIFACFLYCKLQVHRDVLITPYIYIYIMGFFTSHRKYYCLSWFLFICLCPDTKYCSINHCSTVVYRVAVDTNISPLESMTVLSSRTPIAE